jgi:predicted phage-related endonuclease
MPDEGMITRADIPYLAGHVDRRVDLQAKILECKTARQITADWGTDGELIPVYYEIQVIHYMGVALWAESADVATLFLSDRKFRVATVLRDNQLIADCQNALIKWWQDYVITNRPPPVTNRHDAESIFPKSVMRQLEADNDLAAAIRAYREAKAATEQAAEAAEKAQGIICAALGDAEAITKDGKILATWKSAKDSTKTDWQAVATAAGATEEIIKKHTAVKPGSRRFLLKDQKEG